MARSNLQPRAVSGGGTPERGQTAAVGRRASAGSGLVLSCLVLSDTFLVSIGWSWCLSCIDVCFR